MALRHYLSFLLFLSFFISNGQMLVGPDTLLGNEWIRYGDRYLKFNVERDGVYRISTQAMTSAGASSSDLTGGNIRIYNMGQQVPVHVTSNGSFGQNDFIEFYGHKNKGALDRFLFNKPDEDMLNPAHSMYTDKNVYFIAFDGSDIPLRVNTLNNDLANPPAAQAYYLHRESINFHNEVVDPYFSVASGGAVSYSSYLHTEGFGKTYDINTTTQIPALNRFAGGPDATLRLRLATTNLGPHSLIVTLNNQLVDTLSLTELRIADRLYTIPVSLLTDDNQLVITAENGSSRHSLVAVELTYPRLPVLASATSTLVLPQGQNAALYSMTGFPHQGVPPVIYSQDGKYRMIASINGSAIVFKWPATTASLTLEIADPNTTIANITTLQSKVFEDLTGDDTEYVIITHPNLMTIGGESQYAQYRSSPAGGGYKSKAYSILDIYDQFGYGIEKHPQAVRNFIGFFDRAWPSAEMIFIVGRAIEYNRSRVDGTGWEPGFFVPTYGRPGSDNLLAATLWDLVPRFPIGRLAITNTQALDNYLEKVREHDLAKFAPQTIEAKKWIKNVMHLGGGKDASEQNNFEEVLASLGDEIAYSDYGAKIYFFQKESTDGIGQSQSAQILRLLNEGCGIINYLGHSASTTFEFNINDPSEWNNKGRYPIFSAMGCSAGQIHGTFFSLSDNYVQTPDEGAIAFISGSGSQFSPPLISWARPWYEYIGETNYGGTLGGSVLHGLRALSNFVDESLPVFNQYRFLLEQQTFQGDPALRFHPFPGPDYLVDRSSVVVGPDILTTKLDSFDVKFTIANIGRNLRQQVAYRISIKKPDGQRVLVKEGVEEALTYETTIEVKLPLLTGGKAGSFRLLIEIDPQSLLEELPAPAAEANNNLLDNLNLEGVEIFVVDNLITAVYPPDFGIVTAVRPELVATGSNAFAKRQNIVIELDTTALFNSPSLLREKFIDQSATLKWMPQFNFVPDRVYYWRVSSDSLSTEHRYLWSERSFIYKPGTEQGWNQSHFYQFTDDTLEQLSADSLNRKFVFQSRPRNYTIVNRVQDNNLGLFPQMKVDNLIRNAYFAGFGTQNINAFVVAIDSVTGEPLRNPNPGLYGSINHLAFDAPAFAYNTNNADSRQAMINFIENVIPSGYYVFFYTYQRPGYMDYFPEQWAQDEVTFGKSIFSVIENQFPTSAIRSLAFTGSLPYIVFFQKDRGGIQELIGVDSSDVISMSWDAGVSLSDGAFVTPLIGPSSRWKSLQFDITDFSGNGAILSAWALSKDLSDTLWISHHLTQSDTSLLSINAEQYPYMQMSLHTIDSIEYKPADINFWRVLYDGYPEFVINPDVGYLYIAEILNQGDTMKLTTFVENVSDYTANNIPVSLRVISEDNTTAQLNYMIPLLSRHAGIPISFERSTIDLAGDYRVLLDVNAGHVINEINFANNIGILPLYVQSDDLNPVLDVTFDGHHIADGDLVASNPLIVIQLHDENEFLRLDDTTSFAMYLEYPSEFEPRYIPFNAPWVKFIPASPNGENRAIVELRPEFLEDGIYTLYVRAKDGAGNLSGDNDYAISFEVINAESVSHIYNYPNPFNTSTRFMYTLTGSGSPASYQIQIMSITGIMVREITQNELGPLPVGNHMTEYVWDGTDDNGNLLAAGIYLYRMIVRNDNQEEYDRYETSGDQYFRKGWGKLVIIR